MGDRQVGSGGDRLAGPGVAGRCSSVRQSRRRRGRSSRSARTVSVASAAAAQHDDQQDPVGRRIAGADARRAADDGGNRPAEQRRSDVRDRRRWRTGARRARSDAPAGCAPSGTGTGRRRRPGSRRPSRRRGAGSPCGDVTTRRPAIARAAPAAPSARTSRRPRRSERMAGGEGRQDPGRRPDRAADPDERGIEAEGRQVEVEVDPPEAQRDAVDERRDEEDPRIPLEAGKASGVPPQPVHGFPGRGAVAAGRRSQGAGRLTRYRSAVGAGGGEDAAVAEGAGSLVHLAMVAAGWPGLRLQAAC